MHSVIILLGIPLFFMAFQCNAECEKDEFTCANGKCLSNSAVCDGYDRRWPYGCGDNSDEDPDLCQKWDCEKTGRGYWKCADGQRCVRPGEVCDGYRECKDRSDEEEGFCSAWKCHDGYWKCNNNLRCVSNFYLCNRNDECGDNSDEIEGCTIKRGQN